MRGCVVNMVALLLIVTLSEGIRVRAQWCTIFAFFEFLNAAKRAEIVAV